MEQPTEHDTRPCFSGHRFEKHGPLLFCETLIGHSGRTLLLLTSTRTNTAIFRAHELNVASAPNRIQPASLVVAQRHAKEIGCVPGAELSHQVGAMSFKRACANS